MRSREALMKNVHRSKMQAIHFLHGLGHCYNAGSYWTQKFTAWINNVELDQPNDEYVLRGHLDDIAYIQSRGGPADSERVGIVEVSGTDPDSSGLSRHWTDFGDAIGL